MPDLTHTTQRTAAAASMRHGGALLLGLLLAASVHAQTEPESPPQPIRVRAVALDDLNLQVTHSSAAEVVSLRHAMIAAELAGRLEAVHFLPGDHVKTGQVLARIHCDDAELNVEQNQNQLKALLARRKLANQQLTRLNKLKQSNNASEEQINQSQAELDVVNAEIASQTAATAIAEQQVAKCDVRAPYDGLVVSTPGQIGSYALPGTPVVELLDIQAVELTTQLNAAQIAEMRQATAVVFMHAAQTYAVTLRSIATAFDTAEQTHELRFAFSPPLPPSGAVGRLQWTLPGKILAPNYVVSRGDKRGIFILDNAKQAHARFIELTAPPRGRPVAVDLPGHTLVITDGRYAVTDGNRVTLIAP